MYIDKMKTEDKITAVATKIYGAATVTFSALAKEKLSLIKKTGFSSLPVCIAKTQYSFSQDSKVLGAPSGFDFYIKDLVIRSGCGFIVAVAGDILLMPGLSASPAAVKMTISDNGEIAGLF
jgi:formate--tetrahydrofolate ligase